MEFGGLLSCTCLRIRPRPIAEIGANMTVGKGVALHAVLLLRGFFGVAVGVDGEFFPRAHAFESFKGKHLKP